jgi:transcriptional regulator with XRE-family HTH domain
MATGKAPLIGEFIRAHRERLSTSQVGLPFGLRRRAKGLRREEVASLCGISPTWLTWIEQGRASAVSPGTLARIATVLMLTQAERDYLFDLAGVHDPDRPEQGDDAALWDVLSRAVDRIGSPAYVLNRTWDVLAWNRHATDLFGAWLKQHESTGATPELAAEEDADVDEHGTGIIEPALPNLLRFMFLDPGARTLVVDWDARAQRLVAEFRADASADLEQEALQTMVEDMRAQSFEFDALWRRQDVMEREGGDRTFNHPRFGALVYQQLTMRVANAPDLKLVMLL